MLKEKMLTLAQNKQVDLKEVESIKNVDSKDGALRGIGFCMRDFNTVPPTTCDYLSPF